MRRVSFVNRVSHELRSPLTNILLNIDLATELVDDEPDESKRRLIWCAAKPAASVA